MTKNILFIFGTRPEAIKLAPLIIALKENKLFNICICISSQHIELLNQVLEFFNIKPDYNLNIMTEKQTLFDITTKCLTQFETIFNKSKPDLIIVQGDTTTAFTGALAGFYAKIPVAHIEAGLRTFDRNNPFPEEINRKLIAQLATFHFAPTEKNKNDLQKEGINNNIWVVGNTVIDALNHTLNIVENGFTPPFTICKKNNKKLILVTGHRRESIGKPFESLCKQLIEISNDKSIEIIFSLHLNPNIQETAHKLLNSIPNIKLIDPQSYPNFIWMMSQSDLIITDSGGIQEEAPHLGIPVLVTRKQTERSESKKNNNKLVDLTNKSLVSEAKKLLQNANNHCKKSYQESPYGDGKSSKTITSILETIL